jgi:(p)ppGpp synthase/HD superfamily hydrolase
MYTVNLLAKAIAIAAKAHENQEDRAGKPYILHPVRVMMQMKTPDEQMVAILHDVVEDTDWTIDRLRQEGFPEYILDAIAAVTRGDKEMYRDFIERLSSNTLAVKVKLGDLKDNMDVTRLKEMETRDAEMLLKRYHPAWIKLTKILESQTEQNETKENETDG